MTHSFFGSLFGIGDASKTAAAHSSRSSALKRAAIALLTVLFAAATWLPAGAQTSSYVPAVVASSVSPVPTTIYPTGPGTPGLTGNETNLEAPGNVAVDACGNIYTLDHGYDPAAPVTEIPAGGGAPTVAFLPGASYGLTMGQDPTRSNLVVDKNYGKSAFLVPLTNCVAQSSDVSSVGASGPGELFYYYSPASASQDFKGNTYITTGQTCCVTGQYYLIQVVDNVGNILLSNTPYEMESVTADTLQNLYFIMGGTVYELPYASGVYAAAPVPYGKYDNPVGLSVDPAGNLYVADSSAAAIYEIPNEGTAGPNLTDQFVVASGVSINVAVAVNARGDMYYTASGATTVSNLTLGNANFNTVAIGQSASRVVNFQFNTAVTVTNIAAPGGDFAIQTPAQGTAACTTAAYGPGGKTSCQITVGFTPTTVGKESSAIVLTYTIAGVTETSVAFVAGVGQGALLTLDPGTPAPTASGVKSPAGIVVDQSGNTFVADPGNNAVTEYPAGGGAAVPVTIGGTAATTPLLSPLGVAVDGAGDVFIADTGNNRVLEVPFLNGALSSAGTTVVASGLKNPSYVFAHTNGDLYVADTGDNAVLAYPHFDGATNAGATFGAPISIGTGLLAPLAVTVDGLGDVYIADSGNDRILAFPLGAEQEIVAAGILNPSALATDSSGALFVVDQGNFRVLRIPSVQGTLNPNDAVEVGLGVADPYGVAIDGSSNLYVTDKTNGAAYTIARSQVGLAFGDLAVGTASTALPLTVESAGNLPLIFTSPYFTESGNVGDFAMTSPTGACANGITLATGTNCDLSTTFTPTVAGSRSATIALASNAANTPQLTLTGTGVSPSPTTTTLALVTSASGAPFYGEPLSFTATVAPTSGTGTPTGVVSFVVDGIQLGLQPVVKGVATLELNSGLNGGSHTAYAVYKGDSSNNGSSSSPQTIAIARAPTSSALVVTLVTYNNPYSLRHSNTGSCSVTDITGADSTFPAIPNDSIGFTASVSSLGVGVPSGTLTFYSDGQLLNGPPNSQTGLPTSVTALLPVSGGVFSGNMTSDANTLGDGATLGENNVLISPHVITVVYSGDQNYLPSTSAGTTVIVTDVSPTTPVTLPPSPVGTAPYCNASSTITGSRPSHPSSFTVTAPSNTVTASASAPGSVTLTVNSLGGWTGTIDIACPNLPKYTTCTTNPGQVALTASTPGATTIPAQVVVTFTTNVPPYVPTASQGGLFWLTSLFFGLLTIASRRRLRRFKGGLVIGMLAMALLSGIAGLSGCSSSTSSSVVTPAGSYPVTVVFTGAQTDTSSDYEVFSADLPYSVPLTLKVQ